LIAQIFVYGDSLESFIIAVVVPEKDHVLKWAKNQSLPVEDYEQLLQSNELKKEIIKEMDAKAKEYNLTGLEKVKKLHLTSHIFT
jgi:long-chain acyl-CoA synthetase